MFDCFKGLSILGVILFHTLEYFGDSISATKGAGSLFLLISNCDFPLYGFFICAGYGIRKRSGKKCLQQIKTGYLVPYATAAVLAPALLTAVHFLSYHSVISAVKEGARLFLGFLLGQYPSGYYFGKLIFSCGPTWFLVAMAESWFVLNGILNLKNEKLQPWLVAALGLAGYALGQLIKSVDFRPPYCVNYALLITPCLYMGYLAKKKRFFENKPSPWAWAALAAALAILFAKRGEPCQLAQVLYPLGVFSLLAMYVFGLATVYLMTHINRRPNFIVNSFEKLGHDSVDVLIFHTVEYYGLLWYRVAERFADRPGLGFAVIFTLRLLFIAACIWAKKKLRERKERR